MICPRCSVAEISPETGECVLCGFSPSANVMVHHPVADEVQETVQRELAGTFELQVLMARGSRSIVYLARNVPDDQLVALKLLPFQGPVDGAIARAFQESAAIGQSLDHPHLVPIQSYGVADTLLWYTMESVRARSLGATLAASGTLNASEVLRMVEQVASALDYLHRRGLVHGDLKPGNVLIDPEGWVRVTDAVVVHAIGRRAGADSGWNRLLAPEYLAPEHDEPYAVGPSVDQYALAAVAFEALTGTPPSAVSSEMPRAGAEPPDVRALKPHVPVYVADAIRRALAPNPLERFPSVLDFVGALSGNWPPPRPERITQNRASRSATPQVFVPEAPPKRMPVRWIVTVGIALIAVAGYFVLHPQPAAEWATLTPSPAAPTPDPLPPDSDSLDVSAARAAGAPGTATAATTGSPVATRRAASDSQAPAAAPPRGRVDSAALAPGYLSINTTPWGLLYIDGRIQGNTPVVGLEVTPGIHALRVERSGFQPYERDIDVTPGQEIRLLGITLKPNGR